MKKRTCLLLSACLLLCLAARQAEPAPLETQGAAYINNDLAPAGQEELKNHTWTGDFYTETAVEDYFANTPL